MIKGRIIYRKQFTLGADPEMFVFSGSRLMPAFEFLPPKGNQRTMYWDGFQAEWAYKEGIQCLNSLVKLTRDNLMLLEKQAQIKKKNARLSLVNVVRIPRAVLLEAETCHIELGCEPSFNVYRMYGKSVPNPRELKYRFAGGHMHFGTWETRPRYESIVKMLDRILGVWATSVAKDIDSPIRRQYYGLAGEFRTPRYRQGSMASLGYGVEYRVLSNFWLASPSIMQLTWDIGRMAVRLSSSKFGKLWTAEEKEVIETINNCDYVQAKRILKRNEPMLKWILEQLYKSNTSVENAIKLGYEGLHSIVANPEDFSKNWHFADEWVVDAHAPWARWENVSAAGRWKRFFLGMFFTRKPL